MTKRATKRPPKRAPAVTPRGKVLRTLAPFSENPRCPKCRSDAIDAVWHPDTYAEGGEYLRANCSNCGYAFDMACAPPPAPTGMELVYTYVSKDVANAIKASGGPMSLAAVNRIADPPKAGADAPGAGPLTAPPAQAGGG